MSDSIFGVCTLECWICWQWTRGGMPVTLCYIYGHIWRLIRNGICRFGRSTDLIQFYWCHLRCLSLLVGCFRSALERKRGWFFHRSVRLCFNLCTSFIWKCDGGTLLLFFFTTLKSTLYSLESCTLCSIVRSERVCVYWTVFLSNWMSKCFFCRLCSSVRFFFVVVVVVRIRSFSTTWIIIRDMSFFCLFVFANEVGRLVGR